MRARRGESGHESAKKRVRRESTVTTTREAALQKGAAPTRTGMVEGRGTAAGSRGEGRRGIRRNGGWGRRGETARGARGDYSLSEAMLILLSRMAPRGGGGGGGTMDRQRVRSKRGSEPGYGGRVGSSCGSRLYDSTSAQGGPSPRADRGSITCNIYRRGVEPRHTRISSQARPGAIIERGGTAGRNIRKTSRAPGRHQRTIQTGRPGAII